MGNVSGNGNYNPNTVVSIAAIANAGYYFGQWNDGNTQNPRSITLTQNVNYTATFAAVVPLTYQVTVSANDPVMGNVSGNGNYNPNTVVSIAAIANAGYYFVQWNDGNTQNPRSITLTQDANFTATFAVLPQNTYQVSMSSNNAGMGSVAGSGEYAKNSVVTIGAIATTGHSFVQWSDGNTANPRTFVLTKDTAFTAIFAVSQNTYRASISSDNASMGNVAGSGDYAKNSMVTIGAIAHQGYRFVQWNDGNTQNPRTFTLTSDTTFTAIFEAKTGVMDAAAETSSINVYPNPATDNITVVLPENIHQAVFTIYDTQGKMLLQQNIGNQETVSVSNLAAGIYIYHVRTEKESYQGKIVLR
jgi:hypothetical protein